MFVRQPIVTSPNFKGRDAVTSSSRRAAQDTAYRTLRKALRELRERAQLTQEELARKVEIGATYISQVENGHRGIR